MSWYTSRDVGRDQEAEHSPVDGASVNASDQGSAGRHQDRLQHGLKSQPSHFIYTLRAASVGLGKVYRTYVCCYRFPRVCDRRPINKLTTRPVNTDVWTPVLNQHGCMKTSVDGRWRVAWTDQRHYGAKPKAPRPPYSVSVASRRGTGGTAHPWPG